MAYKGTLTQQVVEIISSMEEQGLADSNFRMVYSLKEINEPFFFAELLQTFSSDSQISIRDMALVLRQPNVNYHNLGELCMKVKGGSSCIGACRMAHACGALCEAVDLRSRERCLAAVDAIETEFLRMQEKINTIVPLERKIACLS